MRVTSAVVGLFVLGSSLTVAAADQSVDEFRSDHAVIFDAGLAAKLEIVAPEQAWTPSQDQIAELEPKLTVVLREKLTRFSARFHEPENHIADYYRQYAGTLRENRRTILIFGLHKGIIESFTLDRRDTMCTTYGEQPERTAPCGGPPPKAADFWKYETVAEKIYDGCDGIFWATYDIDTKAITHFHFDGCA